jgi:hypothetical protein
VQSGFLNVRSGTSQPDIVVFGVADSGNTSAFLVTSSPKVFVEAPLHVIGADVFIHNPHSLIITSPNGNCWFITVDNSGNLSSFSVTCP